MDGNVRRQKILDQIHVLKSVRVKELSQEFGVTEETIRRDLEKLEERKLIKRTHGGAVLNELNDLPYLVRHLHNVDKKRDIASHMGNLLDSMNTIMADSSSTVHEALIQISLLHKEMNLITNSINCINELNSGHVNIISTGGQVSQYFKSFVGPLAIASISQYSADMALISCKALSMDRGIFDSNEEETLIKQKMMACAEQTVLLVDSTKFDKVSFVKIADFPDIDILITDAKPTDEWIKFLEEKDVTLIY